MPLFFDGLAIKKKVLIFFAIFLAFFCIGQTALAGGCTPTKENNYCYGLKGAKGEKGTADTAFGDDIPFKGKSVASIIGRVVGAALAFIGIVFFILIIYGGFLWMTARGNEQQVVKAKDLIIAATIGLIIVLAAYAITYYIGDVLGETSDAP